jgi:hypothetical protein
MAQASPSSQPNQRPEPRTVLAAKEVEIALVTYTDESGTQITQLAVVGDASVHLLEGSAMGFARTRTPQGKANDWLAKGIFAKLGRK